MDQATLLSNYEFIRTLGSGATGKVRLAKSLLTDKLVAIKIIKKSIFTQRPSLLPKIQREIALMRLIDHPNILSLVDVIESENTIYIVEEFAANGSLYDYVMALDLYQSFDFFREIIYGLDYLHQHGICHRDLKPENLLLNSANQILIGDFGFACWMPNNIASTSCGSPHYVAPEVIKGQPYDGKAADVWSSGVILYAMLVVSILGRIIIDDSSFYGLLTHRKNSHFMKNQ